MYRWGPPPDPEVVRRSVIATSVGEIDAVLFTSAPGAQEWVAAARRAEVLDDIRERVERGRVLMAAVGPITAGPLEAAFLEPLIAERGRLGSLVRAVVTHFGGGHAVGVDTVAGRLEIRSTGAVRDGRLIPLSRAGIDILTALFDARGGVVARSNLQGALPRSGDNTHAVEMAVARVRESLAQPDLIKTVVKRGYRLNTVDTAEERP
jgi:uroporphyrinogen-III synthase